MDLYDKLKKYFDETPKEQVLKDWEETKIYDNVNSPTVEQFLLHSVSDCFSFARYLNENFTYFDNTDVGNVYKGNDGQGIYSEKDIYDEWLNNR